MGAKFQLRSLWHPAGSPVLAFTLILLKSAPVSSKKKSQESHSPINQKCLDLSLFHTTVGALQCPGFISYFIYNPPVIFQTPFANLKFLHKDPCFKLVEHLQIKREEG